MCKIYTQRKDGVLHCGSMADTSISISRSSLISRFTSTMVAQGLMVLKNSACAFAASSHFVISVMNILVRVTCSILAPASFSTFSILQNMFILNFLKIVKDLITTTLQDVFSNCSTEKKCAGDKEWFYVKN